ncbi:MAG: hypothetical protein J6C45_07635 [Alistipes sp.]|nr:hypothetical protein [Alistipes sp.]
MKPYEVSFYVYAESEEQVAALKSELNTFVREKYNGGVLVTAVKLINALRRFKTNIFVTSFLKQ